LVYRAGISDKSTLRPDELYEMLIKIGLASPRLSIANEANIPALLKLNSQEQLFDKNHRVLQRLGVAPGTSSAEDFLSQKAETRKRWIINLLKQPDSPSRRRGLYALLNLSEYHLESLISKWLKQYLISFVDTYRAPSAKSPLRNISLWPADATEFKALLLKMLTSQQLIPLRDHYGIPTVSEIETLPTKLVERRFDQMKSMSEALLQTFRAFLPPAQQQQWSDEENLVLNLRQALPMFKN
jgi:ribosomal protein L28